MPTLTLICATKNRPEHVIRRISAWCASGVDAVVIVDATSDASKASETEAACERHGANYVRFPASVRDTRSKQRNLGVRVATTEWVLVQDMMTIFLPNLTIPPSVGPPEGLTMLGTERATNSHSHGGPTSFRSGGI